MSERIYDLAGDDVTECPYCVAFQFRDWETVTHMQDTGEGCTCAEDSRNGS